MVQIAVLDDYQNVALKMADWSGLQRAHTVTVFNQPFSGPDEVVKTLAPFEAIGVMRERTPFTRAVIEQLPNLKLIVTTGARNASIDVAAALERGITVCGTPGGGMPTAELAFGLLLSLARNIPYEIGQMISGAWQTTVGVELIDKTLGLVGLGKLGQRMARVAHAFDMKVAAWSQNLTAEKAKATGAELVDKDELFRRSDFVSVHTVLSPRTRGIIGDREIHLMKPSACLINTSRGPIIHEQALIEALKAGRIAGAALDVYDREPLPKDHPLRSCPRLLLTPHLGYVTQETYRAFFGGMVEAMEGWLKGAPVRVITDSGYGKA